MGSNKHIIAFCYSLLAICCVGWTQHAPQPFTFISNIGQWKHKALYVATLPNGQLYAEKQGMYFVFQHQQDIQKAFSHPKPFNKQFDPVTVRNHAVKLVFKNSNPSLSLSGNQRQSAYHNYFIGSDSSLWKSHVPLFNRIRYNELYPHIDAEWYGSEEGSLKYDLIVKPGGDPSVIRFVYEGATQINLKKGKLHIRTSVNNWIEETPFAYQVIEGSKVQVNCAFQLTGNELGFTLGKYNPNLPVIIDPLLVFSTYSGSSVDNFGHSATYDKDGHLYAAGIARNPTNFPNGTYPVTPGAFQQVWGGGVGEWPQLGFPCDIAVSKYSPDGTSLLYATYLGGNRNDYPHSLVTDANNNLIILGTTLSANFPMKGGCYDVTYNDSFDIILSKLSTDGSRLIGSTYIGGNGVDGINIADSLRMNYADEFRGEVMIDNQNDIIVGSSTSSANFPVTSGAYQTSLSGRQDGCIFKLDSNLKQLKASTFLGRSDQDAIYSIEPDASGNIYFTGGTQSTEFLVSPNTHLGNYHGGFADGFIGLLDPNLTTLQRFRYWGSTGYDQSYFIKLTPSGNPTVFGQHFDSVPIFKAAFANPNSSLFITQFKPALDSIIFSTSFGNGIPNNALSPSAFMVDECGVIYGSVWGGGTNLTGNFIANNRTSVRSTTANLPTSTDALQSITDNSDFYLFVLSAFSDSLIYGTYFGELGEEDHVDGGTSRFDKKGIVYQSVCASCSRGVGGSFSTTANAYAPQNSSPRCSNASFKIDFRKSNVVYAQFDYSPKELCVDTYVVVNFTNQSYNGKHHYWYVNGLLKDTSLNYRDTIRSGGSYSIKLVEIDSSRCFIIDSFSVDLKSGLKALAAFTSQRDSCKSTYTFINQSTPLSADILWKLGSGDTATSDTVHHAFRTNGNYTIQLITNPGTTCMDTANQLIAYDSIEHLVRADMAPLDSVFCTPSLVSYFNSGNRNTNIQWYLDNLLVDSTFAYDTILFQGLYKFTLVLSDTATCNKIDSINRNVLILPFLLPKFSYELDSCSIRVQFRDSSSQGNPGDTAFYLWDFGNGQTSNLQHPSVQYDSIGRYRVQLTLNSGFPCSEVFWDSIDVTANNRVLKSFFVVQPDSSCAPNIVRVQNKSINQQQQEWYVNGTLVSNDTNLVLTIPTDSIIYLKLIVRSNATCITADSTEDTLYLFNNTTSDFSFLRDTCSPNVLFFNRSLSTGGEPLVFKWHFGDGDSSDLRDPMHAYVKDTTYLVTLITNPGSFCADTFAQLINYNPEVHELTARFSVNDTIFCAPAILNAFSTSRNPSQLQWILESIPSGSDSLFTDTLYESGVYRLQLVAFNGQSCLKQDTFTRTIRVGPGGIPSFKLLRDSCSLEVQLKNESITLTNNPIPYLWLFGDGDSSTEANPKHMFRESNNYNLTLITNPYTSCADTLMQSYWINGDTLKELEIPNVFTPNDDGVNDCYRVRGLSRTCDTYKVSIYNRWGKPYFQSDNPESCWNGKNEAGEDASPGVYYYIIEIKQSGEERRTLHGTLTLIRE